MQLRNKHCRATIADDGTIRELASARAGKWQPVDFCQGEGAGPRWYGQWDGQDHLVTSARAAGGGTPMFEGTDGDLRFTLEYALAAGQSGLVVRASVTNAGHLPFQPIRCGLKLGVDSWMESCPAWRGKFFPTLLRCEKTHFWGYCMTPDGRVLGIASSDAVASWSLDYNRVSYGEPFDWGGHRIRTMNLDLLNSHPLPPRHPQHLHQLLPGERREWTIHLAPVPSLSAVQATLAPLCRAPLVELDRTTVAEGEAVRIRVHSGEKPRLVARPPDAADTIDVPIKRDALTGVYEASYSPKGRPGLHTLTVQSSDGRTTEAIVAIRHPWSWYLRRAGHEAVRCPPTASQTNESWYGFYSLYLAARHFGDDAVRKFADTRWDVVYPLVFDPVANAPGPYPQRIQNTACTMGMLALRYRARHDIADLERAAGLAEWLMTRQSPQGAYCRNENYTGHYTCVVYPAKSMMELIAAERELAGRDDIWRRRVERQWQSVLAAIEDLVRRRDDIDTEGELTFEDGMISCSALQIAMAALLQDKPAERRRLAAAALDMLAKHRCLAQLVIPDARMRGGTLRFWEAQYDVNVHPNMMNSPHGWSSWRTYATWYAYLLTGDEDWLAKTFDALGSCVQAVDADTGRLRWAFVPDPYIRATGLASPPKPTSLDEYHTGHVHPAQGQSRSFIIGEQYLDMVADWQFNQADDNDVHEHFKCMEEAAMTAAYVVERPSGEIVAYNGRIERRGGVLHVRPAEACICRAHINLRGRRRIAVHFATGTVSGQFTGRRWLGPGGEPELLRRR